MKARHLFLKTALKFRLIVTLALLAALLLCSAAPAAAARANDAAPRRGCVSHPGPLLTLQELSKTAAARNRGPMRAPSLRPAAADLPLAVIVAEFKGMPYSETFNWAKTIFTDDLSLAEYYTDMSLGQFTFTPVRETSCFGGKNRNSADAVNDGVIHVTLDLPHDDWAFQYPYMSKKDIAANSSLADAARAAIMAADAYVDFSAYDTDASGSITTDELALGFVFAGYEASSSEDYKNGKKNYLWSHAWSLQEVKDEYSFSFELPAPDGVSVNSYIAISEREEDGAQEPYSTLAHELGHYMGLPDLYDTSYNARDEWGGYGVGCLSLMCMDFWPDQASQSASPTPLDAWSRVVLGWVTPTPAGGAGTYALTAQDDADFSAYNVIKVTTPNPGEYYLLENRALTKWDAPIASNFDTAAGGVVLWHIDDGVYSLYNEANAVNDSFHRPAVMPLYPEADRSRNVTFTGKNSTVKTDSPFFDRAVWNERFSRLGGALDLPVYGRGEAADQRAGRTLSGVRVEFLSNAGKTVGVRVDPSGHAHFGAVKALREPTCTEAGEGYYECPQCGARFTDETCRVSASAPVALPAQGHTAPNEAGACDRCGETLVQTQDLCPYCHKYHGDFFFQRIVAFFHRVFYTVAHLFGRM